MEQYYITCGVYQGLFTGLLVKENENSGASINVSIMSSVNEYTLKALKKAVAKHGTSFNSTVTDGIKYATFWVDKSCLVPIEHDKYTGKTFFREGAQYMIVQKSGRGWRAVDISRIGFETEYTCLKTIPTGGSERFYHLSKIVNATIWIDGEKEIPKEENTFIHSCRKIHVPVFAEEEEEEIFVVRVPSVKLFN